MQLFAATIPQSRLSADCRLRAARSRLCQSTGLAFTPATALRLPFTQGGLGRRKRQKVFRQSEKRACGYTPVFYGNFNNYAFTFSLLVTVLITNKVAIVSATPMHRQITAFCTKPAITNMTKEMAATVTA